MYELGKLQELYIKRFTSIGAFLGAKEESFEERDVLLPKKELTDDLKVGDLLEVFLYADNRGKPVATRKKPKILMGEIRNLEVVDVVKIGAFVDWGLEKDLFLPFAEQSGKLTKGMSYPMVLYLDKSNRLCASMRIRNYLTTESPYEENDWVEGVIYSIHKDYGAFVAVDNQYEGMIRKEELLGAHVVGEEIRTRVSRVREDGRLDLTLRERGHIQIDSDALLILDVLKANGGFLKVNDNSDPELIYDMFAISKAAFKRAVGNLLKRKMIRFAGGGIELVKGKEYRKKR